MNADWKIIGNADFFCNKERRDHTILQHKITKPKQSGNTDQISGWEYEPDLTNMFGVFNFQRVISFSKLVETCKVSSKRFWYDSYGGAPQNSTFPNISCYVGPNFAFGWMSGVQIVFTYANGCQPTRTRLRLKFVCRARISWTGQWSFSIWIDRSKTGNSK